MNSALSSPNGPWLNDEMVTAMRCRPSVQGHFHAREQAGPAALTYHLRETKTQLSTAQLDSNPLSRSYAVRNTVPAPRAVRARQTDPLSTLLEAKRPAPPDQRDTDASTLMLLRERRRLTQIRYRKKVRNYADAVEQHVQALRQQVQKLELHHKTLSPRLIASTTAWGVAAEYFRLFRFALMSYVPVSERCNAPNGHNLYESNEQRDFLHAAMAPDVIVESGRGVDAILERWRFVSLSQPNFEVEVVRLDNGPGGAVVATTKTKVVLCESMLCYAFPHLTLSERGRNLATKLLGRRMEIAGCTIFGWDSENGRVVSVDGKADVLTPMLRLLGNLDDVAFVFNQALATLQGRLELSQSTQASKGA